MSQLDQVIHVDEPRAPGNLFDAGHLQALSFLDDAHERAGIEQGVVRAGIEPGRAPAQPFDVQLTDLEIRAVQIGDFELAARGRSQGLRKSRGAPVVKINAGDRIVRRRRLGLLPTDVQAVRVLPKGRLRLIGPPRARMGRQWAHLTGHPNRG